MKVNQYQLKNTADVSRIDATLIERQLEKTVYQPIEEKYFMIPIRELLTEQHNDILDTCILFYNNMFFYIFHNPDSSLCSKMIVNFSL